MFTIQHDVLDNFLTLVKIPSESGDELKLVKYLTKRFKQYAVSVKVDNKSNVFKKGSGNIIIKTKGNKNLKPLLLSAHLDTVKPGVGINPQIENNTIYSDGTTILGADDKAGIAAILTLLKLIHKEKKNCCPLEIVLTVSEEEGLAGSKNLDFGLLSAKQGYVLDSSGPIGTACIKAPTYMYLKVEVLGKAAHAAIPNKKAVNAIKIAADAVSQLPSGMIDKTTCVNVGVIKGGTAVNIVPDKVEVEFEIRSYEDKKINKYSNLIEKTFNKVAKKMKGKIKVFSEVKFQKYDIDADSEVLNNFRLACSNLKYPLKLENSLGGSDTNIFNQNNIETLNLSVGYENPHSTNEEIKLDSLKKTVDLIFELVKIYSGNVV